MVLPFLVRGMFFTENDGIVIIPMPLSGIVMSTEVSDALVNYNQYDANSKIEAQRVEALAKAVDATIELYHSKGITYLEVLTAQSQLLSAQLTLAADDFNKMQSVVSLYTALGGGGK